MSNELCRRWRREWTSISPRVPRNVKVNARPLASAFFPTQPSPRNGAPTGSERGELHSDRDQKMLCFVHAKCPNGGEVKGNLQHQAFRRGVTSQPNRKRNPPEPLRPARSTELPRIKVIRCRFGCQRPLRVARSNSYTITWPPFTDSVEPVMNPASSEARKTTQRAISSGSPSRPSGICGRILFSITSCGTAFTISVAI